VCAETYLEETIMKATTKKMLAAGLLAAALTGCSGMSSRDRNTLVGAGVGGVAGSALTNGSSLGTVGGAALGGYLGNQYNRR
jgi:osmotically inducible lipoprotein OsmB